MPGARSATKYTKTSQSQKSSANLHSLYKEKVKKRHF
jgi:hypothetical protein